MLSLKEAKKKYERKNDYEVFCTECGIIILLLRFVNIMMIL